MRLRFAIAESRAHRTGIGAGSPVQLRHRTGKAGLGHVAEGASLVAVNRELLVVQHQLAEQLDLLNLIIRRRCKPLGGLRFNAVDLGLDLRNLPQRLRRERWAGLLRIRRTRAQHGDEDGRCDRQKRALCLHFESSASQRQRARASHRTVIRSLEERGSRRDTKFHFMISSNRHRFRHPRHHT